MGTVCMLTFRGFDCSFIVAVLEMLVIAVFLGKRYKRRIGRRKLRPAFAKGNDGRRHEDENSIEEVSMLPSRKFDSGSKKKLKGCFWRW